MAVQNEGFGPAERIIQSLTVYRDHVYHGRPGVVVPDPRQITGVSWVFASHKEIEGEKVVYKREKGKKPARVGILQGSNVVEGGRVVARYQNPGLFPEVVAYLYQQVAEVWKLDNEFAARWASYAYSQDSSRDMNAVLAAFMMVQSRAGSPIKENGQVLFSDEDYREVGEAMVLQYATNAFQPKQLLRIREILTLPEVAKINHDLGFGNSALKPFYGRYNKTVEKWLRYREINPQLMAGLVKAGYRTTVIKLAKLVGYKPDSEKFFQTLRWPQAQAKQGHRSIALGMKISKVVSWDSLSEYQICEKIIAEKPSYKVLTSRVPSNIGMTPAIVSAAVEAGSLSNKDLVIAAPTLESLGLLSIEPVKSLWEAALKRSEDLRATNIAARVKTQAVKDKLVEASDNAIKAALAEVTKDVRIYVMVDISSSMKDAITQAKIYISKFVQGFDPSRVHVCVFNTTAREVQIKHASAAGVTQAFSGISAGGGTEYGCAVSFMRKFPASPDEDVIFIFVGDEDSRPVGWGISRNFTAEVRASGLNPVSFGLVRVYPEDSRPYEEGRVVRGTAQELGIPCFLIEKETFEDISALPRTMKAIIAATPVQVRSVSSVSTRKSLADIIMATPLLQRPAWA